MKRRLYHAPRSPREINASIPRWLEEIILKCMEVDRSRRYAEASKVLFDLRNPDQIVVAASQLKPTGPGMLNALASLFRKRDDKALVGASTTIRTRAGPSIVLAAVDLANDTDAVADEVLKETARLLACRPDSRLACLTVLKTEILGEQIVVDTSGRSVYLTRLVTLKNWAFPLHLPDDRVSYHVIEAVSPADAILSYAEHNHVDHIVVGARGSSAARRYLGSVSTKVVAEARCSVSVVRAKAVEELGDRKSPKDLSDSEQGGP
jgi:nucleotide-binding universal stress UspA family protein